MTQRSKYSIRRQPALPHRFNYDSYPDSYSSASRDKIFLIQQFFTPGSDVRLSDLQYCLHKNLSSNLFFQIILLVERVYPPSELGVAGSDYQKIKQINIGHPLRFSDIFRHTKELKLKGYICFSNADIFFDQSLQNIFKSSLESTKMMFCQLRLNYADGKSEPFCWEDGRSLRGNSQDAWIFHSNHTPKRLDRFDFNLGLPGADNKLAYELHQLKYNLRNDPFKIKTHHVHRDTTPSRNSDKSKSVGPPYLLVYPALPDE